MALHYGCNANIPEGEPITPIARKRILQGKYFVPDCPDYESKFGLPKKVKIKAVYAGWSCFNCVHLMESREAFQGPGHQTYSAQRAADWEMKAPPTPDSQPDLPAIVEAPHDAGA